MGSIVSLREYATSKRRRPVRWILGLYQRFLGLIHELAKFGVVGIGAALIDIGGFNVLRFLVGLGPLTSATLSMAVGTTAAYLGNRFWTFRHRDSTGLAREYFLFVVMNGIGLLIMLLCLGFTVYTLGLTGPLAANVSRNGVGLVLATAFRYWGYKKWVFLPPEDPPVDPHTGLPEATAQPSQDDPAHLREAR